MINKTKILKITTLIKEFDLEVIHQGNLNNEITIPGLNRTGIELASLNVVHRKMKTAILWSANEQTFLNSLSKEEKVASIERVLALEPPIIFLSKTFDQYDDLIKIAKKSDTWIIKTKMSSEEIYVTIATYITKSLLGSIMVHGTLVSVYGVGVLLTGPSGIGKSEIALELIKKGHLFVGDDAIEVSNFGGIATGEPNLVANQFIEVRGLGILNIKKMFGIEKVTDSSPINVIVELLKWDDNNPYEFERLGNETKYSYIGTAKVAKYVLPITPGRKISDLVESVVIDYKLKLDGYSSADEYITNFKEVMKDKEA